MQNEEIVATSSYQFVLLYAVLPLHLLNNAYMYSLQHVVNFFQQGLKVILASSRFLIFLLMRTDIT